MRNKNIALLLFVSSLLLYSRTVFYGFVWDDERVNLTSNKTLMQGDMVSFWQKPYQGLYIPVSYTVWSLVKKIFYANEKISPFAFHCLNVITHSVNCVLVFLLLALLFKNTKYAFLGSLLFSIHPLQVESVVWISEFRGLLSVLFSLLALLSLFYLFEKTKSQKVSNIFFTKHFIISTALFTFSLLSKPLMVILPLVVIILSRGFYKSNFKSALILMLLWFLIIIPVFIITKNLQPGFIVIESPTIIERFLIAGDSIFFYFTKIIFPYPLAACYGFTPKIILQNNLIYFTSLIAFGIIFFLLIRNKKNVLLFSGVAIIVVSILPVLGFINFDYQKLSNVADRYMYFGMFGAAIVLIWLVKYFEKFKFTTYLVIFYLIILGAVNILLTNTWKDEISVWGNTLSHYKNSPMVYYNHGVQNSILGKFDKAIIDYTECLKLKNDYKDAIFNRANAYQNINELKLALADYDKYLTIDSNDGSVYYKRAYLFYKLGNIEEASKNAELAKKYNFPVAADLQQKLQEITPIQNKP